MVLGMPLSADVTPTVDASISATASTTSAYVGECFTFHGRAQFYNGNPSLRIWKIGTKSIVGISDHRCNSQPDNLSKVLKHWGDIVYGDFTVCPLSKFKKGEMQFACIQSVRITAVEHEKDE
jgi:hypothetical protein